MREYLLIYYRFQNVATPIQAYGNLDYGRRAMILLKHKVLKNIVLRRTKQGRAADLALPPRIVSSPSKIKSYQFGYSVLNFLTSCMSPTAPSYRFH